MSLDELQIEAVSDEATQVYGFCLEGLRKQITHEIGPYAPREDICLRATIGGKLIGGLIAVRLFDWIAMKTLFIEESHRKKGFGRSLVKQTEDLARTQGVVGLYVDTHDFQSPGFYEKLDFVEIACLPDSPKGHKKLFMAKLLSSNSKLGF